MGDIGGRGIPGAALSHTCSAFAECVGVTATAYAASVESTEGTRTSLDILRTTGRQYRLHDINSRHHDRATAHGDCASG